jgi:uncharacterized protein YggE
MLVARRSLSALAALSIGALAMTSTSDAQEAAQRQPERTVTVSASGSIKADPDVAHVSTGVVTEGATAREALDKNTVAMKALIDGLKAIGIEAKDTQTTHIGVEPRYQSNPKDDRPPTIVGYRVTNQVRIVQRTIARLGETLDKAVTLGANQIHGIQFEVSRAETLKDEARRAAMANARRRAELYATAAGAQVDRVLAISETVIGGGPRPMADGVRMAMAEAVPVEPGTQTLDVNVHVVWSLK